MKPLGPIEETNYKHGGPEWTADRLQRLIEHEFKNDTSERQEEIYKTMYAFIAMAMVLNE